jgi:hypothetical protein
LPLSPARPSRRTSRFSRCGFSLIDDDVDCETCHYIRAVGDIEAFTAAQFRDFIKAYRLEGHGLTVVLSSPGGDVIAGLRLGREIREQGFNTQVGFPQRLPRGGYRMRPAIAHRLAPSLS